MALGDGWRSLGTDYKKSVAADWCHSRGGPPWYLGNTLEQCPVSKLVRPSEMYQAGQQVPAPAGCFLKVLILNPRLILCARFFCSHFSVGPATGRLLAPHL